MPLLSEADEGYLDNLAPGAFRSSHLAIIEFHRPEILSLELHGKQLGSLILGGDGGVCKVVLCADLRHLDEDSDEVKKPDINSDPQRFRVATIECPKAFYVYNV